MSEPEIKKNEIYRKDNVVVFENIITVNGKDIHRVSLSFGKNAVLIIPVDDNNNFYLVKERRSDGQFKIDFPSGGLEKNESAETGAKRELSEEIGYEGELEYLGLYDPFYSVIDMRLNIFLAKNVKKQSSDSKLEQEFYESIEILKLTEAELFELISKKGNVGFYTLGALSLLKSRKGSLNSNKWE